MALKKGTYLYTTEEVVDNIKCICDDLGYIPKRKEYCRHPLSIYKNPKTLCEHFGNWESFLINQKILPPTGYAGTILQDLYKTILANSELSLYQAIKISGHSPSRTTKRYGSLENIAKLLYNTYGIQIMPRAKKDMNIVRKALIADYKRIRNILNRPPNDKEYRKMTNIVNAPVLVYNVFQRYSNLALAAGDMIIRGKFKTEDRRQYYIQCLKDAVKQLKKTKKIITAKNALQLCPFSGSAIDRMFGNYRKWFGAANIPWHKAYQYRWPTKKEVLESIRLAAYGRPSISFEQYKHSPYQICTFDMIKILFGSWYNAVHKLGLKIRKHRGNLYTNKTIIIGLRKVAQHINGKITMSVYDKWKDDIMASSITVGRRFGSWDNALKAAGLK